MKKRITIAILALATMALSFTVLIDKSSATVNAVDGINVFAFSKPTGHYDVIGTVKVKGMVSSEKGPYMVGLLVKYAKKDYPSAEAIVVNEKFDNAEVIKFKE